MVLAAAAQRARAAGAARARSAAAASPRARCTGGSTYDSAAQRVVDGRGIAGSGSMSTRASLAARARAPASRVATHREHRLAGELHLAVGEDRVVVDDRADVVGAGNVGRR